jgi:hypothetical protein
MAILGDSTVTGAATNPHLKGFFANMAGFILDIDLFHPEYDSGFKPLRRVTYSPAEWAKAESKGMGGQLSLAGESKLSRAFDIPEYSWAYQVGLGLKIRPREMLMVAQDGKKVGSLSTQLERVMSVTKTELPPLLLISYGLNDICHPNDVGAEIAAFKTRFKQTVASQIQAITRLKPNEAGTTVFISAPLDATNLMDNDELMSQKIPFEGAGPLGLFNNEISCKELRDKSFARQTWPGLALRDLFIGECKGLRADVNDPKARVEKVRALQTAQMEAWREAIAETNVPGFHFIFGESVRSIRFEAGDLANDCFHPSRSAHTKIANQFIRYELGPRPGF